MVTKNQIKLIKSLHQKKYRKQHQLFIAEGIKVINELIKSAFVLEAIYVTEPLEFASQEDKLHKVSIADMEKMSALTSPSNCLAVFQCVEQRDVDYSDLVVALDDIRDPGNMGTIIRLCDWFGVKHIICTKETVDIYNPKVIQATMGSITRVNVVYGDLSHFIQTSGVEAVFGTFMDGDNIYKQSLPNQGIIVFGNEANGISSTIEQQVTKRIAIPRFGDLQQTESLNVAMASSIVLSEFRRSDI
ncbi:MAG: RNA methyltransferase [Flavobacteriaceae bacterium]|jgi:TrmH family RNA methyltransferase|nr:RNA methyltransferase [Flavobacteriaceae bacterium]